MAETAVTDLSPAEWLADSEVAVTPQIRDPSQLFDTPSGRSDPWGQAVAAFLADLLDNVEVSLHPDCSPDFVDDHATDAIFTPPVVGVDGRLRNFSFRVSAKARALYAADGRFPAELADLPDAALRALARVSRGEPRADVMYPSVAKALHDVIIAEVLADRLARRAGTPVEPDDIARLVAETLDYFTELAGTRIEGQTPSHGVVIATDWRGLEPLQPPIIYPGHLPSRKRTPLVFDGTLSVLVVTTGGHALAGVGRHSLPRDEFEGTPIDAFDEFPGVDGALTAAASAAYHGVGVYLRPDQSIWVFDDGTPLFIRRTSRWKSIALDSFAHIVARLGETDTPDVAARVARAAIRSSLQGHGAIIAIAPSRDALDGAVQLKDRYPSADSPSRSGSVDDELHRLLPHDELGSARSLAWLARIDGATIVDPAGNLLAYGAIVHSTDSRSEGARTAAARALSRAVNVALTVSQDGPITVFHKGEVALEFL